MFVTGFGFQPGFTISFLLFKSLFFDQSLAFVFFKFGTEIYDFLDRNFNLV
jgi:hypothetical protein